MHQRILGMLAVLFALAWGEVHAGPITYSLSFDDGGGNTLVGTVITDGVIGPVAATDITDWSFTATGFPPLTFAFSASTLGAGVVCAPLGCFTATAASLDFDFGHAQLQSFDFSTTTLFRFFQVRTLNLLGNGYVNWSSNLHLPGNTFEAFPQGVTSIGRAIDVPEPNVIALLGVALAAGFGVARKRVREPRPIAV